MEAGAVECSLDTAIPLGLIANEAISNSLKHAFPSGRTGRILVRLHWIADETSDRTTELLITDDGVGLQGAVGHSPGGIGMTLIEALADQIDASVTVRSIPRARSNRSLRELPPGQSKTITSVRG